MATERDIALNLVAEMREYRAELLRELPGITEKAATKAALKQQQAMGKGLRRVVREQRKAAAEAQQRWSSAFQAVAAIGLGAIVKETVAATYEMRQGLADLQNQIGDTAAATGIARETISAMGAAVETSGGSLDELLPALRGYPKRLADFAGGTGEAARALEALGFTAEEAPDLLQDMDGGLREVISRLQGVESTGTRSALATDLWGESGTRLAQVLGAMPLEQWEERAARGVDVSREAIRESQRWEAVNAALAQELRGAAMELSGILNLNNSWRLFAEAVVTGTAGMVAGFGELMEVAGKTAAAWRALFEGDLDGVSTMAEAAIHQWAGVPEAASEAAAEARESYREAVLSVGQEVDTVHTRLESWVPPVEETTSALREARDLAADYGEEAQKVQALVRQLQSDVVTAEEEIAQAREDRDREISMLWHKEVVSQEEAYDLMQQNAARHERDLQALAEERAADQAALLEEQREREQEAQRERIEEVRQLTQIYQDAAFQQLAVMTDLMETQAEETRSAAEEEVEAYTDSRDAMRDELEDLQDQIRATRDEETRAALEAEAAQLEARIGAETAKLAESRKAAKKAAKAQKAAAILGITVNTAEAVLKAFALFGPPPSPPGVASAAAATAAGLTQATIVASEPLPTFYGGRAGAAPGEVGDQLHAGESVLTSAATSALGPEVVQALNAFPSAAAEAVAGAVGGGRGGDVILDGARVGRQVARRVQRPGDLSRAVHHGAPVGVRSRR